MNEVLRPPWIKDHMTVDHAARLAYFRGYTLKSEWHPLFGLRIVAIPRQTEKSNGTNEQKV